ncbi:recombinase family protein [bacterium]|nr:recombinase family protein [bacterium]
MNDKPLRFAPLIRVSTEKQAAKGESLRTQRTQIERYVESLGGVIPEHCWKKYSGQEHATPDNERRKLNLLLEDSGKDLFDAIIVCDHSRWSRDNRKSKDGLEILRDSGIRFFVGTSESDLDNAEHLFFLGMAAEINEFQAKLQSHKSIRNRIERAKRGLPATGKLPSGRTYINGEWDIDEEFQKKIQMAAEMIIGGSPLKQTSEALGLNRAGMRKTLLERCGETWYQNFHSDSLKINESIPTEVPRLLPDDMIAAVKLRLQQNKTIFHGQMRNKYLLGRMILCVHCGKAMFGLTSKGKQYYRHANCENLKSIPAATVDEAVLVHLFSLFGNRAAMEQAIQAAIPDYSEIDKLETRKNQMEQELKQIKADRSHLLGLAKKRVIEDGDLKEEMDKLRDRESTLRVQLAEINQKLSNIPSKAEVGEKADLLKAHIQSIYTSGEEFAQMNFDERRKLVQMAFSGQNPDGTRPGVYVKKNGEDDWSFEIKGVFPGHTISDYLPMEPWKANVILGIEDDNYNPFSREQQETLSSGHQP